MNPDFMPTKPTLKHEINVIALHDLCPHDLNICGMKNGSGSICRGRVWGGTFVFRMSIFRIFICH